MKNQAKPYVVIILPDIRSKQNVGSIFRTSDACGASKIYLTGTTPRPIDRFGRVVGEIVKTALGAEQSVEWEYKQTTLPLIKKLKKEGFYIIAIEQTPDAVDYKKVKAKPKTAFVFGNEVEGVHPQILKQADITAEIPMLGQKESLNVAVSCGAALFRILNL